jgi:predicted GNAT family N-acyltransferase
MNLELEIDIKRVEVDKIRPLRHAELRKGQDFSTTSYLNDNLESTFHMASILDGKIVTCSTFNAEKSNKLNAINAYRLRGMATNSSFQRKGYARELMRAAFLELKLKGADFVWCNARLAALDFYKSIGFKIQGDLFDIDPIGPHYYMFKEIY